MSRVADTFADARRRGAGVLMPYLTAGDPDLETTEALLPALADAGAGIIEIGIPFSDPIADGPVIAEAMHRALERGVTPEDVFEMIARVRSTCEVAIVVMVSTSIVDRVGVASFATQAATAGVDGLIVPDADVDACDELRDACEARDLAFVHLVAPTSTGPRLDALLAGSTGFVYLLARAGITGERDDAPEVGARVAELRARTDLPIAVGFGISRPEHVAAVLDPARGGADGAIVGSALVRSIHETATARGDVVGHAAATVRALAGGVPAS